MKGFALNEYGDTVIERNDIRLAYDADLVTQKIRQVLSTNRGEWEMNPKEGIPVRLVLKKNPNVAMIKDCIRSAVRQVDPALKITRCETGISGRTLNISFAASGKDIVIDAEMEV